MLEDPSNLYVVDLATVASDGAGVPVFVQVMACLFIGCCFTALNPVTQDAKGTNKGMQSESLLTQKSIISMIDSRIGYVIYLLKR